MEPLQPFDFDKSPYDRPNLDWLCGHLRDGRPCEVGPRNDGVCVATTECTPMRTGDRWRCMRSKMMGGSCVDGPNPGGGCSRRIVRCQPMSRLHMRRRRLGVFITLAAVGLVVLALSGVRSYAVVSPGLLSNHHVALEDVTGAHCADCHTAAHPSWEGRRLAANGSSALCLRCHGRLGPHAMTAHGLSPKALADVRKRGAGASDPSSAPIAVGLAAVAAPDLSNPGHQMECAQCHTEHLGKEGRITRISDSQCQVCHSVRFESFQHGHPEFVRYPYRQRTSIAFDHTSHGKYFGDRKTAFDCQSCHALDERGRRVVSRAFEQACASCHSSDFGKDSSTLTALSVPRLDVQRLARAGLSVGEWPKGDDGKMTTEIDPVTALLLSSDSRAAETLADLPADLSDLSQASEAQLKKVYRLAWAIKALLNDIATGGSPALQARLDAATKTSDRSQELAARLPVDLIGITALRWFPSLRQELAAFRRGGPLLAQVDGAGSKSGLSAPEGEQMAALGGWFADDGACALMYRVPAHGDRFVVTALDVTGGAAGRPASRAAFEALGVSCLTCHSADQQVSDGALRVHWKAEALVDEGPARFSHRPHRDAPKLRDCLYCHTPDTSANVMETYEGYDPRVFKSGFTPIRRAQCVTCHTPEEAGESCTKCHDYHVGAAHPAGR